MLRTIKVLGLCLLIFIFIAYCSISYYGNFINSFEVPNEVPKKYYSDDSMVTIKILQRGEKENFYSTFSSGTGHIIDQKKQLIRTAYHVVKNVVNNPDFKLGILYKGKINFAQVLTTNKKDDLATIVIACNEDSSLNFKFTKQVNLVSYDRAKYDGQTVYLKGFINEELIVVPAVVLNKHQLQILKVSRIIKNILKKIMWNNSGNLELYNFIKADNRIVIKINYPNGLHGMSGGTIELDGAVIGTLAMGTQNFAAGKSN